MISIYNHHMPDFTLLPDNTLDFFSWTWERIEPFYTELEERPLSAENVRAWLHEWSLLTGLIYERLERLMVASSQDSNDTAARQRRKEYFEGIFQPAEQRFQRLRERWVASGLSAPGYERQLASLSMGKKLFFPENQALVAQVENRLGDYNQLLGAQTVSVDGQEYGCGWGQNPLINQAERAEGERLWRLSAARILQDRAALEAIWEEIYALRQQMARNAGYPNYLEFRWAQLGRPDYTPADCTAFHAAILRHGVPAATRAYQRRARRLSVDSLRPWDLARQQQPQNLWTAQELCDHLQRLFERMDPQFGQNFALLRKENMLDLEARPNKPQGGYTLNFAVNRLSFISLNVSGSRRDALDLIHECGHAFSIMESRSRDILQFFIASGEGGGEWTELTSQALTMLAYPYLSQSAGGFIPDALAAEAEVEDLEDMALLFLPNMAVVDAFQHWAYTHPEGGDVQACEAEWLRLSETFEPGQDWSGLETERATAWLNHGLIFGQPLFFVDYGISLLGALQIRRAADLDQSGAVARYRHALSQAGSGITLPELYAAAGARFAFDEETLAQNVSWITNRITQLSQ